MFALKGIIISVFAWLMTLGSIDLTSLTIDAYAPEAHIAAADDQDQVPLFFDAILEVNQSSTYETPPVKLFSHSDNASQRVDHPFFYQLSYYRLGQQIMVSLSTKTIIFPFHCFT